jgi:hypothetical protein
MVHLSHLIGERERFHTEEMKPQISVGLNPLESLTNGGEDGCLSNGDGIEVV